MSGRSGYVRVGQATRSQRNDRKLINAPVQPTSLFPDRISSSFSCVSESQSESSSFYHENCITFGDDEQDRSPSRYAISPHTRIILNNLPTKIERSPFRVMMDERCAKYRNGIRRALGIKEWEDPVSKVKAPEQSHLELKQMVFPYHHISNSEEDHLYNSLYLQTLYSSSAATQVPALRIQISRWLGDGRISKPWAKLHKDPEIFDLNGDTLVYLCNPEDEISRPPPSFRISSHIIEATHSITLIKMLQEGSTEHNVYGRTMGSLFKPQGVQTDGFVSYEIFFPVPPGLSKLDALRHQVTTRNVFALFLNSSLVGQTMYQALYDLQDRIEEYMPANVDSAGIIIDWIKNRGIDDPRHNPSTALSLLAWAEGDAVRWECGWKEAFCHTVGMRALDLDNKFELLPEYHHLSPITKTLIDRFSTDTQLLIRECESRLDTFDFTDMWSIVNEQVSAGRSAFDRFRNFLVQHYQKVYGKWPPSVTGKRELWLTRSVAQKLSLDFAALYDYLVNRSVSWDCAEERADRKWKMKDSANQLFDPNTIQLPMTDILISFDNRMKYPHIPHPYCLTPEPSITGSALKNGRKVTKKSRQQDIMLERQAVISYQNSTNVFLLGPELVSNDLVNAYVLFEQADRPAYSDPYNSRRGRWVLIYAILQVLASVSVDTPGLRFVQGVNYHLRCSLRRTPPWAGATQKQPEAKHEQSHCWLVSARWHPLKPVTISRRSDRISRASLAEKRLNAPSEGSSIKRLSSSLSISSHGVSSRQLPSHLISNTLLGSSSSMMPGEIPESLSSDRFNRGAIKIATTPTPTQSYNHSCATRKKTISFVPRRTTFGLLSSGSVNQLTAHQEQSMRHSQPEMRAANGKCKV